MKTDSATHRGSPPPPGDAELPAPGAQLGSPQTWKRTRGPRCPFLFGERHGVGGWRGLPPQFSRGAGAAGTPGSEEQPQNQVQNRERRAQVVQSLEGRNLLSRALRLRPPRWKPSSCRSTQSKGEPTATRRLHRLVHPSVPPLACLPRARACRVPGIRWQRGQMPILGELPAQEGLHVAHN